MCTWNTQSYNKHQSISIHTTYMHSMHHAFHTVSDKNPRRGKAGYEAIRIVPQLAGLRTSDQLCNIEWARSLCRA